MAGTPLDERMKGYEAVTHTHLCRKVPVIVRVDGRAFHGVTQKWPDPKPFCEPFMDAMVAAARVLADDMQGFRLAYIQSDEASFLLVDYDKPESEPWFGYDVQKLVSVSAAQMTLAFARAAGDNPAGVFDARAFNVPKEEAANCFLWRARDWARNSLEMYARAFFSQKQLHKANRERMHELLHGIGRNWTTDLPGRTRNGTWLIGDCVRTDVLPKYENVAAVVAPLLEPRGDDAEAA